MAVWFKNIQIRQGDTLDSIATRTLNDAGRAGEIAALNRLRYPFISDDPRDQFGDPVLSTSLSKGYDGGATLVLQDTSVDAFQATHVVLLTGTGGRIGSTFSDTATVVGTGIPGPLGQVWSPDLTKVLTAFQLAALPSGNVLYLDHQLAHQYAAGTGVAIYRNPALDRTFVLGTGATLRLPGDADLSNILTASAQDFASLLGTDLAVDKDGFLDRTLSGVTTIAGTQNLAQAVYLRAVTNEGELTWHQDYGNAALAEIGRATPATNAHIYAGLAQCLLADPRISALRNLQMVRDGDAVIASAHLLLADNATLLNLHDLVLRQV